MLLDFLNRDIFSSDAFSGLSDRDLRKLDDEVMRQIGGPIEGSPAELRTLEENRQLTNKLINIHVEIAKELTKRKLRWQRERGGFWVALFLFVLFALSFLLWLAARWA